MASPPLPSLNVQAQRIQEDLTALEGFTDPALPYTRQAFSPQYHQARKWLAERMRQAGLEVRIDAASNLIGRLPGQRDQGPILMLGSHTDTVLAGGRFDGIVGVLGALEVIRCLREAGITLQHPLEVVDFTCEEPTLLALSPMGSRIMAGDVTTEIVAEAQAPSGEPLAAAINALGGDAAHLERARRQPGEVLGYLELHIEQGPVLERQEIPVGVVTAVAGPYRGTITLEGQADHAGATLMGERRDALVGAAELIVALEGIVTAPEFAPDAVGTIGWLQVEPNMVNVVPGRVEMSMDIRSTELEALKTATQRFEEALHDIAQRRGLRSTITWQHVEAPVPIPKKMQALVAEACDELGIPYMRLPSRASHDAARLAPALPVGMVFIPCKGGKSHTPEEWVKMEDIARGTQVLGRALLKLDQRDE